MSSHSIFHPRAIITTFLRLLAERSIFQGNSDGCYAASKRSTYRIFRNVQPGLNDIIPPTKLSLVLCIPPSSCWVSSTFCVTFTEVYSLFLEVLHIRAIRPSFDVLNYLILNLTKLLSYPPKYGNGLKHIPQLKERSCSL